MKDPLEIPVVHIRGHQRGTAKEAQGNNIADQITKEAASEKDEQILQLVYLRDKDDEEIPIFSEQEQKGLQKQGGAKDEKGKWTMPGGTQVLNKTLRKF